MKNLCCLAPGLIVVALTTGIEAGEQDAAKLLIGTWEVTKADKGAPWAVGDTLEFEKGKKAKITRRKDDKDVMSEGGYKLKNNKIVTAFSTEKGIAIKTLTINKITDTELVISHEDGDKIIGFKRKK